jgi:cytochrome c oxidase assembly protein subunit 15
VGSGTKTIARATWALLGLLALQTLYGAFMAGTRAGYYFGTFPDMAGRFAPQAFFTASTFAQNLLDHPPAIHWIHRALGFLVLAWVFGLWVLVQRVSTRNSIRRAALLLGLTTFAQLNLGAITVLSRVHLPWAVAHQGLGYLVLSAATLLLHRALRESAHGSPYAHTSAVNC